MPIQIDEIKLYSASELCEALDVSQPTLRKYIREGRLKAQKIGGKWYVTEDSLKSFLEPERNKEGK